MLPRTAEIKVHVELDGNDLPTRIEWQASDTRDRGPAACESMMLSFWDSDSRTIAAIDLWVKDLSVDDMNLYFYQAIHRMADTYLRATRNTPIADSIHAFGRELGEALGLVGEGDDR